VILKILFWGVGVNFSSVGDDLTIKFLKNLNISSITLWIQFNNFIPIDWAIFEAKTVEKIALHFWE
jgi:hypothetical protein